MATSYELLYGQIAPKLESKTATIDNAFDLFKGTTQADWSDLGLDKSLSTVDAIKKRFSVGSSTGMSFDKGGSVGTSSPGLWDNISAYFIRGVVIILGLVFVAAALAMFGKSPPIKLALPKGSK